MSFTRRYRNGSTVNLTAPATHNSKNFARWTRDGSFYAATAATSLQIAANTTMQAEYDPFTYCNDPIITFTSEFVQFDPDGVGTHSAKLTDGGVLENTVPFIIDDGVVEGQIIIDPANQLVFGVSGFGLSLLATNPCSLPDHHWFYQWGPGPPAAFGPSSRDGSGGTNWEPGESSLDLKIEVVSGIVKFYFDGILSDTSPTDRSGVALYLHVFVGEDSGVDRVKITRFEQL
jgi:hypothetical protein